MHIFKYEYYSKYMNKNIKYFSFFIIFSFIVCNEQDSIYEKENLAKIYTNASMYNDAIALYQDILELKTNILGKYNADLVQTLQ